MIGDNFKNKVMCECIFLYTSLSFTRANHMFPFLCKLFAMEEQYQQLGESFFNKPFEYFINELDKLQIACNIQYAVLVLCLVNGSKSIANSLQRNGNM
jgi:hypothetical protein